MEKDLDAVGVSSTPSVLEENAQGPEVPKIPEVLEVLGPVEEEEEQWTPSSEGGTMEEVLPEDPSWQGIRPPFLAPRKSTFERGYVIKGKRRRGPRVKEKEKEQEEEKKDKKEEEEEEKKTKRPRKKRLQVLVGSCEGEDKGPTLGVRAARIAPTASMQDAYHAIVEAFACLLPIEARANLKLYFSPHLLADALHLFRAVRQYVPFPRTHRLRKWTRQGGPDSYVVALNSKWRPEEVFRLNVLPRSLLAFKREKIEDEENAPTVALAQVREFLRGCGPAGRLIRDFVRRQPTPPGFRPETESFAEATKKWKVFLKTTDTGCVASDECQCEKIAQQLVAEGIKDMPLEQAVMKIMHSVPSSLDKPKAAGLRAHYQDFIDFVIRNPGHMFFPERDEIRETVTLTV